MPQFQNAPSVHPWAMLVILPAVDGANALLLVVRPRQPLLFATASTRPSTLVLVRGVLQMERDRSLPALRLPRHGDKSHWNDRLFTKTVLCAAYAQ